MKFAVVEYTSKTGKVWRHTAEKPNYLCDPQKELDPTSFGCYVSALEGEHIPLMTAIQPTFLKRIYRRLLNRWPDYDISYFKDFDVLMVVHQISNGHEITRFVKRLKDAYPHIKVLGVPTQPYGILKEHWDKHPDWLQDFHEFAAACDSFITIVKDTAVQWKAMFPDANVQYLPQPYPVEYAARHFKSRADKESIIFVAGVAWRENIPKGLRVARALQRQFPEYIINIAQLADDPRGFSKEDIGNARVEVIPFQPWEEHLDYLSRVMLVINTDYTSTRGRVQMDAAVVGTPSIGADSDGQRDLFAELPASESQTESELATQGARLLSDSQHYDTVIHTATQKLKSYTYDATAIRIKNLVNSL